jgi:ABC-type maltose transport system permease subunit
MNLLDTKSLALIVPIIIIQLVVQVIALVDLYKREHVIGGKKWIWALVIIFGEIIGAGIYLIFGRKDA